MARAMYEGTCIVCEFHYAQGSEIVPWRGGYIHAECAKGED